MPVVDQTGLPGAYNFKLDWTPAVRAAARAFPDAPEGRTLFEAVEAQLGLKLEEQKHPIPVLVIDKVNRTPSEN